MKDSDSTPKIIGLTGGIGSGKTTVAKIIEEMGYPVYSSDIRAKNIVNDNEYLKQKIIALLGKNAYNNSGQYHRKWVAEQIFNNDSLRLSLNAIIHPAVRQDFEQWVMAQKKKLAFQETALLFELNLDKNCHKTILVTANEDIRIKRVMERDHKTEEEVKKIIQKQMPEIEKQKRADFVIFNEGEKDDLKQQITNILTQLI